VLNVRLRGVIGGDSWNVFADVVLECWETLLASIGASDEASPITNLGRGGMSFSSPARSRGVTGIVRWNSEGQSLQKPRRTVVRL